MKRPKKVKIKWREVKSTISEYTCPFCHTTFIGAGVRPNVTRFICDCGNELIVEKEEQQ